MVNFIARKTPITITDCPQIFYLLYAQVNLQKVIKKQTKLDPKGKIKT